MTSHQTGGMSSLLYRLRHPALLFKGQKQIEYSDLLRRASRTQSLEDLLRQIPDQLGTVLGLESFHLFVLETDDDDRQVFRSVGQSPDAIEFAASSATVLRMRRERRPVTYCPTGSPVPRDAWQMLASPVEIERLDRLTTQLLVPFTGRTGLMGFAAIARFGRSSFSKSEISFLRELGRQMGLGLETALLLRSLTEQAVQREIAARDLSLAKDVQEHLLPRTLPSYAGVEFSALYRSMGAVGGDYYDVIPVSAEKICIVVADVSGKGVGAALLMSALRAALHTFLKLKDVSSDYAVSQLNEILVQSSSGSQYATLFLAIYDRSLDTLSYCNAGHTTPLLRRASGEVISLTVGGTVVGLFTGSIFQEGLTTFNKGDVLVVCTDGITEGANFSGEEWSDKRLMAALQTIRSREAPQISDEIYKQFEDFVGNTPQNDDITMLVAARK